MCASVILLLACGMFRLIKFWSLWWILFFLLLIWELSVSSRAASHQRAVNVFGCHPSFCFPHPSIFKAEGPDDLMECDVMLCSDQTFSHNREKTASRWSFKYELFCYCDTFPPPFFCESITFIHLHQDILKNWPTNPAELGGITGMVSRLCTFFIHAPVSIVRVGCIATGAQLEVAGAG